MTLTFSFKLLYKKIFYVEYQPSLTNVYKERTQKESPDTTFLFWGYVKSNKDIPVFTKYILLKASNNLNRQKAILAQLYL